MDVIQSWEDHNNKIYAVVKHSEKDQKDFGIKEYEAMWLDETANDKNSLFSFGGSVGYRSADSDTVNEAENFLFNGISLVDSNPDISLDMAAA